MRTLITGATGFIGSASAVHLLELGCEVRLLLRNPPRSLPENLNACEICYQDLCVDNPQSLRKAVDKCDVVLHCAAIRNRWGTRPEVYSRVNVDGTRHLIEACLGRAKRFVYVSSVGVFGYPGVENINESFPVIQEMIVGDYHSSKVAAERVVRKYQSAIETVIVRPTITYGPGDETGMVTRMVRMIYNQRFIMVGSGYNHIHLTYIDDLATGLYQAMVHPRATGETFILAGKMSVQIHNLVQMIGNSLGVKLPKFHFPERPAFWLGAGLEGLYHLGSSLGVIKETSAPPMTSQMVNTLCANRSFLSTKAENLIGFRPQTDLETGLTKTIAWIVSGEQNRGGISI